MRTIHKKKVFIKAITYLITMQIIEFYDLNFYNNAIFICWFKINIRIDDVEIVKNILHLGYRIATCGIQSDSKYYFNVDIF